MQKAMSFKGILTEKEIEMIKDDFEDLNVELIIKEITQPESSATKRFRRVTGMSDEDIVSQIMRDIQDHMGKG